MTCRSPALANAIASLRTATPSGARGRLSKSLHALIAAIFARIFARLEQIILLWQTGNLPTPPRITPNRDTPPNNRRTQARAIATAGLRRIAQPAAPATHPQAHQSPASRHFPRRPAPAQTTTSAPPARPRTLPARAPPPLP